MDKWMLMRRYLPTLPYSSRYMLVLYLRRVYLRRQWEPTSRRRRKPPPALRWNLLTFLTRKTRVCRYLPRKILLTVFYVFLVYFDDVDDDDDDCDDDDVVEPRQGDAFPDVGNDPRYLIAPKLFFLCRRKWKNCASRRIGFFDKKWFRQILHLPKPSEFLNWLF